MMKLACHTRGVRTSAGLQRVPPRASSNIVLPKYASGANWIRAGGRCPTDRPRAGRRAQLLPLPGERPGIIYNKIETLVGTGEELWLVCLSRRHCHCAIYTAHSRHAISIGLLHYNVGSSDDSKPSGVDRLYQLFRTTETEFVYDCWLLLRSVFFCLPPVKLSNNLLQGTVHRRRCRRAMKHCII